MKREQLTDVIAWRGLTPILAVPCFFLRCVLPSVVNEHRTSETKRRIARRSRNARRSAGVVCDVIRDHRGE
jgi:hypothetical protein